jgi:hypothetical protein
MRTTRVCDNIHQVCSKSKIESQIIYKYLGANKPKSPSMINKLAKDMYGWGRWFGLGLVYGVQSYFQQYFSYIVTVRSIGGGNR